MPLFSEFFFPKFVSKNVLPILIWTIGLIVFIGLATKDLVPLITEYTEENVATRTEVIADNASSKPPILTLCVPFGPVSLKKVAKYMRTNDSNHCDFCQKLDEKFLNLNTINLTDVPWYEYGEKLPYDFFNRLVQNETLDALNSENSDWNRPLVDAALIFFSCLAKFDDDRGIDNDCMIKFNANSVLGSKQIIDNLFDHLMRILCGHIKIRPTAKPAWENYCEDVLTRLPARINIKKDTNFQLCFTLQTGNTSIVELFLNSTAKKWPAFEGMHAPIQLFNDASSSVCCSNTGNPLFSHTEIIDAQKNFPVLKLEYSIKGRVVGKHHVTCYNQSTPVECICNCAIEQRIKLDQCVPFTYRKSTAAIGYQYLPYCNTSHVSDTRAFNSDDTRSACSATTCNKPCDYVQYNWLMQPEEWQRSYDGKTFRMTVIASTLVSPYMQFTIAERWTREQFIANMAGIFNLNLGISGMTLVAVIIECVKMWKKWKKKDEAGDDLDQQNVSNRYIVNENIDVFNRLIKVQCAELEARIAQLEKTCKRMECFLEKVDRRGEIFKIYRF